MNLILYIRAVVIGHALISISGVILHHCITFLSSVQAEIFFFLVLLILFLFDKGSIKSLDMKTSCLRVRNCSPCPS